LVFVDYEAGSQALYTVRQTTVWGKHLLLEEPRDEIEFDDSEDVI
jgi:hypothetical protein